ncbi:MAG: methyltransferase domain-containing protein [Phycisphaerae bacterium]
MPVTEQESTTTLREASDTRLRPFLEAYWLRPENAFWMALRSWALSNAELEAPSLDLSCGDGIFTFLHLGGRLDPAFDVFGATGHLNKVTTEHADMFDFVDQAYQPGVIQKPDQKMTCGSDWKSSLLSKAERIAVYEELTQHDNNQPLPWSDATFKTIYSNSIYWVKQLEKLLVELKRVLKPDGKLILHVKLSRMRDFSLAPWSDKLGDATMDIIGRGRFESWPNLLSQTEWEQKFRAAGFEITDQRPFVNGTHARIWDVGLRPIAPLLVRMANALQPDTRSSIKEDWVNLFLDLLKPICQANFDILGTDQPVELQYTLSPL